MNELQKLCDKVPSFDNATAMAVIEAELGAPWQEFYSELSPDPIAAASLGQVPNPPNPPGLPSPSACCCHRVA